MDRLEQITIESHLSREILDPDFICFFLSYLRESSTPTLYSKQISAAVTFQDDRRDGSVLNCTHQSDGSKYQMMSTPKVRDGVVAPKSDELNSMHLSEGFLDQSPRPCNSNFPGNTKPSQTNASRSHNKSKNKPLTLSDFLGCDGSNKTPQSSSKKRWTKNSSQKSRKLTPNAFDRSQMEISKLTRSPFSPGADHFQSSPSFDRLKFMERDAKSPVNPLLSEASRSISFDLEDKSDFPILDTNLKIQKPKRRINPTKIDIESKIKPFSPINTDSQSASNIENSVTGSLHECNPFASYSPITVSTDVQHERQQLMLKRLNPSLNCPSKDMNHPASVISLDGTTISPVKRIFEPNPANVIDANKIDRLVQAYALLINSFLVPCVVTELQFVIDLLTIPVSSEKLESNMNMVNITGSLCNSTDSNPDDHSIDGLPIDKLLSTIANAVYFAMKTLEALSSSGVILILGRSTLSSLTQNYRLQSFSPSLQAKISELVENLDSKEAFSELKYDSEQLHSFSGVPFEAETDDRSNFTSDKTFHAFRKHRDLFYSLMREYEEKQLHSNFSFQQNLGGKVNSLVMQVKEIGTFKPFTRLFVSQMIGEVNFKNYPGNSSSQNLAIDSFDENGRSRLDLVTSLRRGDPEKFRRLQSRFITASSTAVNGASKSLDIISQRCYFFKEFLLCADSYNLNIRLCNEIWKRINDMELRSSQQLMDDVLAETMNAARVSATLSRLITSLRVLGRFLGFLTFQPYQSQPGTSTSYEPNVFNNVINSLEKSMQDKVNLMTIPWVTEYLKAAQFTVDMSSEAKALSHKLFNIFKFHTHSVCEPMTTGNVMIALAISTLFELPVFSDGYFYQLLKKCPSIEYSEKLISLANWNKQNKEDNINTNPSFDECCLTFVSLSLIYEWHPILREIHSSVLSANLGNAGSITKSRPPRKIKPSTEKKSDVTILQRKEKQLQIILEENFFRGQPSSLKRTVSFVAERCASNCVKHIRSIAMLDICNEAEKIFLQRMTATEHLSKIALTREVISEMKIVAISRMKAESKTFCEESVPKCMGNLTSCETAEGVSMIATAIAKMNALVSVHSWLNTRLDELVTVSVKARLSKVLNSKMESNEQTAFKTSILDKNDFIDLIQVDSISSLLHVMKEYIVRMTFCQTSLSHSTESFKPAFIDGNMSDNLTEKEVTSILEVARLLLINENVSPFQNSNAFRSMRKLIESSSHLRNSLILTSKELSSRSAKYFRREYIQKPEIHCA